MWYGLCLLLGVAVCCRCVDSRLLGLLPPFCLANVGSITGGLFVLFVGLLLVGGFVSVYGWLPGFGFVFGV